MYINKSIENLLSFWLIIMFVLVSSIIVVGGLTRLTDSGLSITEWELFKGLLPPLSSSEWIYYFDLYKFQHMYCKPDCMSCTAIENFLAAHSKLAVPKTPKVLTMTISNT